MAEGGKKEESDSASVPDVFKKISRKNGQINRMNYSQLRKIAKGLKINLEGSSEILRRRLKSYYKELYLSEACVNTHKPAFDFYIVVDFEATCEQMLAFPSDFQHEIIEFPAVLVDSQTLSVVSVFHQYVKPTLNKTLSKYCTTLTGISQDQVDSADTFPCVLKTFEEWMHSEQLIGRSAFVTDGPWDMAKFLYTQVKLCRLQYPKFANRWVNIKKTFSNFYKQRKPTLDNMLQQLNIEFEGKRHSGLDDSLNIAKVLIQMLKDGATVHVNERIDLSTVNSNSCNLTNLVKPVKAKAGVPLELLLKHPVWNISELEGEFYKCMKI